KINFKLIYLLTGEMRNESLMETSFPMKILFSLFAGFVVFVCAPRTSADVLYIDEKFDYPDGDLGNPWVVENNTESATAKVGAAQMFQSYTPEGRQTTLGRPVAGDGMVNAKSPSGSNAGTVSWLQPEQER